MKSRETDMVYTQEVMHKMSASNTKKKEGKKEKKEKKYMRTHILYRKSG